MLYMFQAVPLPIIGSSKTVHTASGTCQNFTAACRYGERVGNISELIFEALEQIRLSQHTDQWQDLFNTVLHLSVP
jgi:hypothetical protein